MYRSSKAFLFSFLFICSMPAFTNAQGTSIKEYPKNWYQLDKTETGYYGISLDKAYQLVKNRKSKTVLVAVIDNGIDTLHEDLKSRLWKNPGEIPGNGKDDDLNGYVDDIYGWNFIGGKDGRNVYDDASEEARIYYKLKAKYGNTVPDPASVNPEERAEVEMYRKAKEKVVGIDDGGIDLIFYKRIQVTLHKNDSILKVAMNKTLYTGNELDNFEPRQFEAVKAKSSLLGIMKVGNNLEQTNKAFLDELDDFIGGEERKEESKTNPPRAYRAEIVQDDETNINDRFYGNNDVMAGTPIHGTHTSGIIAAIRNNGVGMDGIADNVKIMMIRVIPNGDEHDKDIALAIRYAVDNGAQIINMSFGKEYSPEKLWVDDAVRYADSKGVLLVLAAGNDHKNIDLGDNFPNPDYLDGKGRASNFITVGASGDPTNGGVAATFSNYGKKEVDIFAPGVRIYSTIAGGNTYGKEDGTSMAAPVVAGTAAFLLSYFPELSAKQLKMIIEKSATHLVEKVKLPGTEDLVTLSDISKSGGIVNVYEAAKLAQTVKGERKVVKLPVIKPTPKIVKKKKG